MTVHTAANRYLPGFEPVRHAPAARPGAPVRVPQPIPYNACGEFNNTPDIRPEPRP